MRLNSAINTVTTKNNNLKALLGNTKNRIVEGKKSSIYKIQREKCDKRYVDRTKRNTGY